MKTITAKQLKNEERKWYLIDANGQNLGRLSTKIAIMLRGKNNPSYTPHLDNGDYVVVINASKVQVTGNKIDNKKYYSHSFYMGGLKEITMDKLLEKKPLEVLKKAINGMLPKNKLRKDMISRLKLVEGTEHIYSAQKPEKITL